MIYTFIIYYYIQNKYNYILPKTIWNIFKFIMSFSRYTKIYNEYNEQYTSASQLCITNSQKERKRKQERKKEKGKKFSVTLLLLHAILTTLRIYRTGHLFYVLEINTCNKVISRLLTYLYDMKKPIYSAAVI